MSAYGAKNVRASAWISSAIVCSCGSGTVPTVVQFAGSSKFRRAMSAGGRSLFRTALSSAAEAAPDDVGGL